MVNQSPENLTNRGNELLNRLPVNLQILFNEAHQLLPQLKRENLLRPLVVAILALQMAGYQPTSGNEIQPPPSTPIAEPYVPPTSTPEIIPTASPAAVTENYQPPLPTPQSSETPAPTPTSEPTLTPTPPPKLPTEASQSLPKEVVLKVPIDAQDLSLSCESSASAMVAEYFLGKPPEGYKSWEEFFIKELPPDYNPHYGFCGAPDGHLSTSCKPPYGYGVYAEPLARILKKLGLSARVSYGTTYEEIKEAIARGEVPIVWVSTKDPNQYPAEYRIDPQRGEEYVMILGEHTWVIAGYRGDAFLVLDPWKGRVYWVNKYKFPRWPEFDNMTLFVHKKGGLKGDSIP